MAPCVRLRDIVVLLSSFNTRSSKYLLGAFRITNESSVFWLAEITLLKSNTNKWFSYETTIPYFSLSWLNGRILFISFIFVEPTFGVTRYIWISSCGTSNGIT